MKSPFYCRYCFYYEHIKKNCGYCHIERDKKDVTPSSYCDSFEVHHDYCNVNVTVDEETEWK